MSSLRSIIQKGRFYLADYLSQENMDGFVDYAFAGLSDPQTKLINAQSVWDDTVIPPPERRDDAAWDHLLNFEAVPRPKPPFEKIWLEAAVAPENGFAPQRIGALVLRVEGTENILRHFSAAPGMPEEAVEQLKTDRPATLVNALMIHDHGGSATPSGNCIYWLNQDGKFLWSFRMSALALDEQEEEKKTIRYMQMRMRQGWILHSFARMNCANARLVPVPNGHKHHRHHGEPSSVWHVIQISAGPRIRHTEPAQLPDGECHIRFHWVRGHYADYTRGRGLFGNPKLCKVFWIPEHQAGDKELGEVMSSYTVQ
jgi:hypothetical protein